MSALLHLVDFNPPQPKFSEAEKSAIMASTRELLASARTEPNATPRSASRPAPISREDEDPIAKWKREADEKAAADASELAHERQQLERKQRQRELRQRIDTWQAHLETRLATEREYITGVLTEAIGQVVAELTAKIRRLESEVSELKKR